MITRDEIIRMATQAGWQMPAEWDGFDGFSCRLERFARAAYEAGAKAEREACAEVCDEVIRDLYIVDGDASTQVTRCAAAIRARGQK